MLPIAVSEGMPWHFLINEGVLTQEVKDEVTAAFNNNPGNTGWMVRDEPRRIEMENVAEITDWLKQEHPDSLIYTNVFPIGGGATEYYGNDSNPDYGYSDYLNDTMEIIKPDVLMYDFYPLGIGDTLGESGSFYTNMVAVRNVAKDHDVPYFAFVQSYEKTDGATRRLPSDSDLRFLMFTHLAAGYRGFSYFGYDPGWPGLVDLNGNKTSAYDVAGPVNAEVELVGNAMRALTSTDVRFITNPASVKPEVLDEWSVGAGFDPFIEHVAVDTNPIFGDSEGQWKDGMIGFFQDDLGERYFMITNTFHAESMGADETLLHYEVRFDDVITEILKLNNVTGETEVLTFDAANTLRIAIPGGTGFLFKYNTGVDFAVPEPSLGILYVLFSLIFMAKTRTQVAR